MLRQVIQQVSDLLPGAVVHSAPGGPPTDLTELSGPMPGVQPPGSSPRPIPPERQHRLCSTCWAAT